MTDLSEDARQNPAADAEGKSLAELFASDPMELTVDDRAAIIKRFRKDRTQFMQTEKNKSAGKQRKGDAAKGAAKDLDIDVDEIDI